MTEPTHDFGHLVVTLTCGKDGEGMTLMAHTPEGPVPVYIEVAEPRACRCGAGARKIKMRIVAPKSVRLQRIERSKMPD